MSSILSAYYASNAAISASGSQIPKQEEQLYTQSNLIGTWSGNWSANKQPITITVLKITGATAEIQYTQNGNTQKAQAQVSQNTISFGNITIGTKNGTNGAAELQVGSFTETATLTKTSATPTDPNKLVGSWSGLTSTGNAASFTVTSVAGTSATVNVTVDGIIHKGTGTYNAANNLITFAGTQLALKSDGSANVTFSQLGQTYAVPVTKASTAASKTSTVSTFA